MAFLPLCSLHVHLVLLPHTRMHEDRLGVHICPVSTVSKWLTVSKWWTIPMLNIKELELERSELLWSIPGTHTLFLPCLNPFAFTSLLIPRIAAGMRLSIHGWLGTILPFDELWHVTSVKKHSNAPMRAWWSQSVTSWGWSFTLRLVSYSLKSVSKYLLTPIRGCGRLGTRVEFQLESIKTLWSSFGLLSLHCMAQTFIYGHTWVEKQFSCDNIEIAWGMSSLKTTNKWSQLFFNTLLLSCIHNRRVQWGLFFGD